METIEGCIDHIIFRNSENGYTVINLVTEEDDVSCVGVFSFISEGEYIQAEGEYTTHPVYGEQFNIKRYDIIEPTDVIAMERYLASGAIKGIKEAMAHKIVSKFKDDTFKIMENQPERLAEIKGISLKKAREIGIQFEEKREMRSAMIYLQNYGISNTFAVKIYQKYGGSMYSVIQQNPYKLAEDISGIGFRLADEIATKVGINTDSEFRIRAGIIYELSQESANGNIYIYEQELLKRVVILLNVDLESIQLQLDNLAIDRKVIIKEISKDPLTRIVYSAPLYYAELNCARMLCDLNVKFEISKEQLDKKIDKVTSLIDIELDECQREAVAQSVQNGITVITGGPGTGKTTTINTIIRLFESENINILLAAPTGRAAKRMSETTNHQAQTIHRLLEISGGKGDDDKFTFERNEENPLEADVIIIDEMSMVDINLMNALLRAVVVGARLILVGDVNQLPSVGPGCVLKDIIDSNCFNVVKLNKIFRQATQSDIVVNAHKINDGKSIVMDNKSKDFFVLQRNEADVIAGVIVMLIRDKLPGYVNAKAQDIQVLTPMKKGELGVEKLNKVLQHYINPPSKDKKERESHGSIFREQDKVMQIKNNYQLEWEIKSKYGIAVEKGMGVFNGDSGIIKSINEFAETVEVEFEEGRIVEYKYSQLDELELSYAITIHKAQGSEYPAVVIPMLMGPKMLMTRNILYTAVTRAKKCVTIVGKREVVQFMIDNVNEQKRNSSLNTRIEELLR